MAISISVPAILDDVLTLLTFPFLLASAYWLLLHRGWQPGPQNLIGEPWAYLDSHVFAALFGIFTGYVAILYLARVLRGRFENGWIWFVLWLSWYAVGVGMASVAVFVFFASPKIPQWAAGGFFLAGLRWMSAATRPLKKPED